MAENPLKAIMDAVQALRSELTSSQERLRQELAELRRSYDRSDARTNEMLKAMAVAMEDYCLILRGDANGQKGLIIRVDRMEVGIGEVLRQINEDAKEREDLVRRLVVLESHESRGGAAHHVARSISRERWKVIGLVVAHLAAIITALAAYLK